MPNDTTSGGGSRARDMGVAALRGLALTLVSLPGAVLCFVLSLVSLALDAVRRVAAGGTAMDPQVIQQLLTQRAAPATSRWRGSPPARRGTPPTSSPNWAWRCRTTTTAACWRFSRISTTAGENGPGRFTRRAGSATAGVRGAVEHTAHARISQQFPGRLNTPGTRRV